MLGSIKELIVAVDKIITFFIITNYKTFNYGIKFYLRTLNKKLVFISKILVSINYLND